MSLFGFMRHSRKWVAHRLSQKLNYYLYIVIVINSVSNKRREVGEERYPSLDVLGLFFCI